jgi:hypothetical protein
VQASRLVRSTPPGSTPVNRPDAGVHVKAAATGVTTEGAAHGVLGLNGVASGGRVVEVPGGTAHRGEDATSSDAEGGSNAVNGAVYARSPPSPASGRARPVGRIRVGRIDACFCRQLHVLVASH